MVQKLSFSVENAEIINENPNSNFAILELDFFASGKNLHNMYVSEETLIRTADTIKKCPLIWRYDEILDDIGTHDKEEVPCGFVPETSVVKTKSMADGRTMLSVIAYVWKRYTGELLSFFKRDGGKKPVSVEMSVYKTQSLPNDMLELLDYRYEGITVLGTFVTPAIPSAKAQVLSFSELEKEYKEDVIKEFSDKELITFPYESIKDVNPSLRGIYPPITVSQANEIARQAESIGSDDSKNGWAIAISSFKKTHRVVDGKWVKKETKSMAEKEFTNQDILGLSQPEKEEVSVEEEKKIDMTEVTQETEVTMAEDVAKPEEKVSEEKAPAEEKKEEEKEKKFEFPKNFNLEKMQALFSDDEDEDDEEEVKMAKAEIAKGEFANPSVMMSGMFAKMCKMAEIIAKMAEDSKVYMAENEELKKFKADVEKSQKAFAVEQTLKELEEKVIIPSEAKEEMLAKAEEISFADLDSWKTYCKAKSFEFVAKDDKKEDVVRVGMPFSGVAQKKKNDLWS